MIRLSVPDIDYADLGAVAEVLASGQLVQGKYVRIFENEVAAVLGQPYTVAVSSCTAALHLSLLALRVVPSDKVAVPAYSWPATANVVRLCGAHPVFIDIDPITWNMNPERLDQAFRAEPDIRVVLPVHVFGGIADMNQITQIAGSHNATIIEDAACALGAKLGGRPAGLFGRLGCFSLHPRKAITTGEGGLIVTADASLQRRLRALRNHGQDPEATSPDFTEPGFNYRLTDFQAALGSAQLKKLELLTEGRRSLAAHYTRLFAGTNVTAPFSAAREGHVYQSYTVLLPPGVRRDLVIKRLRQNDIEVGIGTYNIPMTSYYRHWGKFTDGQFPVAADVASRSVSLPMHSSVALDQAELVVHELLQAL